MNRQGNIAIIAVIVVATVAVFLYQPELVTAVDGTSDMEACNAAKKALVAKNDPIAGRLGLTCKCTEEYNDGYFVKLDYFTLGGLFAELDANYNVVETWDRHRMWKTDAIDDFNQQLSTCSVKTQEEVHN